MSDAKMDPYYFAFIKDCLLKFNYPLAHSMSDDELADIFKSSNRCFLICWIFKLLDSTYEEVLENYENNKEFLGNLVYELGFCALREKSPFMTGELPVGEQVKIIFNLFTFVTDIKRSNAEEKKDAVSNDELVGLKSKNLNLFPMYGDIKYIKSTERCSKLYELKKEIDDIKACISTENGPKTASLIEYKFNDIIEEFLVKLKADFPKIAAVVKSLTRDEHIKKKTIFELQSNSAELIRECSENLRIISKFVKDVNVIRDFVESNTKINAFAEEITDETSDMIQTLYQEILYVRKYARCL